MSGRVCASGITVATAPMVLVAILEHGTGYWLMAGLFMAFLIGGYQIILYTYQQTRDQIALRDRMTLVARKDHLTGLVNRFGLGEAFADLLRINRRLEGATQGRAPVADDDSGAERRPFNLLKPGLAREAPPPDRRARAGQRDVAHQRSRR